MSPNSTQRPNRPHAIAAPHARHRSTNPLVNYELEGPVRWLDVPLERMVVEVRATDGHAGPFLGQDVTVDLEAARLHGATLEELVPGTDVEVRLRLPRDLGGELPDLLPALSVRVLDEG